ncbi:hypothetical protein AAC387_Pa02g4533 [Persea americana]
MSTQANPNRDGFARVVLTARSTNSPRELFARANASEKPDSEIHFLSPSSIHFPSSTTHAVVQYKMPETGPKGRKEKVLEIKLRHDLDTDMNLSRDFGGNLDSISISKSSFK